MSLITYSWAQAQSMNDVYRFSQNNFSTITARSAGMGGAFVSLGSDASSMSVNPAGMGMYRRSEIAITPILGFNNTRTSNIGLNGGANGAIMDKDKTRFGLANFSAVFTIGDKFVVGAAVNRLADYRGTYQSQGAPGGTTASIADMFVSQLDGIPSSGLGSPAGDTYQAFRRYGPNAWGAILGYQTYLVDAEAEGGDTYHTAPSLYAGDIVLPIQTVNTYGGIDEIDISFAGNLNRVLYYGVSFGIQNINYKEVTSYSEIGSENNHGDLDNFTYNQTLVSRGTGFNIKLGVTAVPTDWLRIGVAYHSPTWAAVTEEYGADMTVYKFGYAQGVFADSPILKNEYSFSTPQRLMIGASAVVARKLILSADYERAWFSGMKFRTSDLRPINAQIKNSYDAVNVMRFGVEYQPVNKLFLRLGYSHNSSAYKAKELKKFEKLDQYSAGIGFRSRGFSIDAAYVYGSKNYAPTEYYVGAGSEVQRRSNLSSILLSMAVRF